METYASILHNIKVELGPTQLTALALQLMGCLSRRPTVDLAKKSSKEVENMTLE